MVVGEDLGVENNEKPDIGSHFIRAYFGYLWIVWELLIRQSWSEYFLKVGSSRKLGDI